MATIGYSWRQRSGFALVGVVLWGSLSGSMLPFLLKKCGLDPATSSAPFVATLVDVTGLIIYFMVALVVLLPKIPNLPLHPGRAALGERFDFVELGHRDVAGKGGEQCAVGPAEPQCFFGGAARKQAVDQAGGEAVAAADAVEHVERGRSG